MMHVWDGQIQLLVCFGGVCSEVYEHMELDILTKTSSRTAVDEVVRCETNARGTGILVTLLHQRFPVTELDMYLALFATF